MGKSGEEKIPNWEREPGGKEEGLLKGVKHGPWWGTMTVKKSVMTTGAAWGRGARCGLADLVEALKIYLRSSPQIKVVKMYLDKNGCQGECGQLGVYLSTDTDGKE